MIVDLRADVQKAREISIHLFITIEEFKKNFSKKDLTKVQIELSELSFRLQTSQENVSNCSLKKRKRSMN